MRAALPGTMRVDRRRRPCRTSVRFRQVDHLGLGRRTTPPHAHRAGTKVRPRPRATQGPAGRGQTRPETAARPVPPPSAPASAPVTLGTRAAGDYGQGVRRWSRRDAPRWRARWPVPKAGPWRRWPPRAYSARERWAVSRPGRPPPPASLFAPTQGVAARRRPTGVTGSKNARLPGPRRRTLRRVQGRRPP